MNHDYHNPGAKIVKFNDMALYGSILFKKTMHFASAISVWVPHNYFWDYAVSLRRGLF